MNLKNLDIVSLTLRALFLVFFLSSGTALGAEAWGPPLPSNQPQIVSLRGKVMKSSGQSPTEPKPVRKGDRFDLHEVIDTGNEGQAKINLGKKWRVEMSPNSKVELTYQKQKEAEVQTELTLHEGEMLAKGKYPEESQSKLRITTPQCRLTAQNGKFSVKLNPESGQTVITVQKGRVSFAPTNINLFPLILREGQIFAVSQENYHYLKR